MKSTGKRRKAIGRAGAALRGKRAGAAKEQAAGTEGLNPATREKILVGAMIAVSRQGTTKLAMGDICHTAGVSRGTLYRYFATKDDVLHAMGDYISTTFEEGVVRVARQHTDPVQILRAVMDFHFSQARQSARVLEIEPMYVIGFLRDHFPRHVAAINTALAPVFDHLEKRAGVKLNRDLIGQTLIRIELSTLLVPADPSWNNVPEALAELLRSVLDTSVQGSRSARAQKSAAA